MYDYSCESSRVSSIRIFLLAALEERGPMHGHQLRLLAEEEHVALWTDITVGSLYGAIKRLAAEELIEEVRVERSGAYPQRQVWAITDAGREALGGLRLRALRCSDTTAEKRRTQRRSMRTTCGAPMPSCSGRSDDRSLRSRL